MTNIPDYVKLEMRCAQLMAQQEASGFRFDLVCAEQVKEELAREAEKLSEKIRADFPYFPGKVFTPKRTQTKNGYFAGAPMTKLLDFNPTSRQHIAWALTTFRGARFIKQTDTGKPKVDEAILSEIRDTALSSGNPQLAEDCDNFIQLLNLQKSVGQLSEGANSWLNSYNESTGCIHHSCSLATVTGRNAHRGPNLGQVNSAPWARKLFVPHQGHQLVGVDLEGLELRVLGHYLAAFDEGNFADVVVNGDVHQQNADRVGCTRKQVKTLTYAFMYGAGDAKLGHSLQPELSDSQKKALGSDLRRKFLEAIPGLGPLVDAVKEKVRIKQRLKGLDGRPIHCRAEHSGLNFLCQSAGAILSKRWVVIGQELLDAEGLEYDRDYTRCAYVHDEVQLSVVPSLAEKIRRILESAASLAGEYYHFRVPITASGNVGENWAETH